MPNPQSAIRNPQSGEPLFRRMTVVGAGLIGGSLGLAARQAGAVGTIIGVNRSAESRQTALRLGLVDEATEDLAAGVREANLVVLAVPVHRIVALIPEVARHAPESCLVTDVGSVKGPILQAGDAAFPDGRFVAGHPIAGQERSGPAAARADLFQGATWILTPSARTRPEAVERVTALCGAAAAQVVRMDAAWHDEVFATVSHLPHLVAYALMDAVLHMERGEERLRYSAGGLRDFTRVAGSDPDMWRDIFLMNREALLRSVTAYREAVTRLEDAIRIGDGEVLRQQLLQARIAREELLHGS